MTRSTIGIGIAIAMLLAGCGRQPTNESGTNAGAVPDAAPEPVPAASVVPTPVPSASASPEASVPGAENIPSSLQGRWGLVPADCTSTRGDAKGLLVVSAEALRFYESRATLGKIVEHRDSRIVADFGFSGEGQTWTLRVTLDGQDGGQTLVRREQGEGAMPGALRYRRCG